MCSEKPQMNQGEMENELRVFRLPFQRGEICPYCGQGTVDYNSLLDLECPVCGYSEGFGGGCT